MLLALAGCCAWDAEKKNEAPSRAAARSEFDMVQSSGADGTRGAKCSHAMFRRRGCPVFAFTRIFFAVLAFAVAGMALAQNLSPQQQLARDIYKELIEINTVTDTGDTLKAAEA